MTSPFVSPRLATRLVTLFSPSEEAESILGDLLEEYSHIASQSGISFARRWYWRQTVKTIAHLAGNGFRVAPWTTTAAVAGGFLLHRYVVPVLAMAIFAILHRSRVFDYSVNAYIFFANYGISVSNVIASFLIGCLVGLVAKEREMVATMTLSFILTTMTAVAILWWMVRGVDSFLLNWILWNLSWQFPAWVAIAFGGAIVRTRRSSHKSLPSEV